MGKAARNERLKLHATFLNNIAAGFLVGGLYLPFIVLAYSTESFFFRQFNNDKVLALAGMFASLVAAMFLHFVAYAALKKIED